MKKKKKQLHKQHEQQCSISSKTKSLQDGHTTTTNSCACPSKTYKHIQLLLNNFEPSSSSSQQPQLPITTSYPSLSQLPQFCLQFALLSIAMTIIFNNLMFTLVAVVHAKDVESPYCVNATSQVSEGFRVRRITTFSRQYFNTIPSFELYNSPHIANSTSFVYLLYTAQSDSDPLSAKVFLYNRVC